MENLKNLKRFNEFHNYEIDEIETDDLGTDVDFDEFDEIESGARDVAIDDIELDYRDNRSGRQLNFRKDSKDQLFDKLANPKYAKYHSEIKDELASRPRRGINY